MRNFASRQYNVLLRPMKKIQPEKTVIRKMTIFLGKCEPVFDIQEFHKVTQYFGPYCLQIEC